MEYFVKFYSKLKHFYNPLYVYFTANVIAKFFLGFAGVLLARFLSKEEFGFFKTVTTFIGLVSIFMNFGLNDLLLFKLSKNSKSLIRYKVIKLFLFNYAVSFPISLILFSVIYSYTELGIVLFILFFLKQFFDWIVDINNRVFQSKDRFLAISIVILLQSLLMFILVFFLYIKKETLISYSLGALLISMITASLSFFLSKEWQCSIFKKGFKNLIKTGKILFKSALPFFVSSLMVYIYMQSDILMLSLLESPKEVSRYAVVSTIISAAYLIPTILYNYFLPKLILNIKNRLKIIFISRQFLIWILISVVPLGLIFFLFPEKIIKFLYNSKYLDSFIILKILSVVFIFHSFCFLFGALLTASGNQVVRSKIQFLAAVVNIFFNLILIPFYKAEGAALATAITEIVIFTLYFYITIKVWREKRN